MSNPRYGNNFIDANVLVDRTGGPEDVAVDMILRLHEEGAFTLLLPYSVKAEIEHPNTPTDVKRKALQLNYSIPVQLTAQELETHDRIRTLIRGNARPGQHDDDAFHLVESAKYGGRYFLTNDRRLLDKAPEIWEMLLIRTIKPSDFLAGYIAHANGAPA
jgi:predicted nucleic acid-binding protein